MTQLFEVTLARSITQTQHATVQFEAVDESDARESALKVSQTNLEWADVIADLPTVEVSVVGVETLADLGPEGSEPEFP